MQRSLPIGRSHGFSYCATGRLGYYKRFGNSVNVIKRSFLRYEHFRTSSGSSRPLRFCWSCKPLRLARLVREIPWESKLINLSLIFSYLKLFQQGVWDFKKHEVKSSYRTRKSYERDLKDLFDDWKKQTRWGQKDYRSNKYQAPKSGFGRYGFPGK